MAIPNTQNVLTYAQTCMAARKMRPESKERFRGDGELRESTSERKHSAD